MPDENTNTIADATQPAPVPAEGVKPEEAQPATAPADVAPTLDDAAPQQPLRVTRGPTKVARDVTKKGAPNAVAAAKPAPAKTATPPNEKIPDYRKLKLSADDVIGGVRKENPWKAGTKGHGYYAKYRTGMTVAEAVKAGIPRGYVAWDAAHGFITVTAKG
jgi:hypothetical protein